MFEHFYPERTITVTSRDPDYITAETKALLRRKNRLMRSEEASAVAKRIGENITKKCRARLNKINGRVNPKRMWDAVRMVTGRKQKAPLVEGMTAVSLNQHCVQISTDSSYQEPSYKDTACQQHDDCQYMTEWRMFNTLDNLHHTSTGMDQLPAWFLRLGAPVFCQPLATLFNLSVSTSVVPRQ